MGKRALAVLREVYPWEHLLLLLVVELDVLRRVEPLLAEDLRQVPVFCLRFKIETHVDLALRDLLTGSLQVALRLLGPLALVKSLQPDVLVKGGDYDAACTDENDRRYMVGSAEVRSWGGRAVAVPLVPGQSTTATLKKIRTS